MELLQRECFTSSPEAQSRSLANQPTCSEVELGSDLKSSHIGRRDFALRRSTNMNLLHFRYAGSCWQVATWHFQGMEKFGDCIEFKISGKLQQ
jgi:hypothetical protein